MLILDTPQCCLPHALILKMKLITTATNKKIHNIVGPSLSSYGPDPLILMALALQWYVTNAYTIVSIAIKVNKPAEILPTESPKLSKPTPRDPKITVKFNHDKKVLSLAKNTFGSTRAGKAILLFWLDIDEELKNKYRIW